MQLNLGSIDLFIIVVYLVAIVGFGCWVGLRLLQFSCTTDTGLLE